MITYDEREEITQSGKCRVKIIKESLSIVKKRLDSADYVIDGVVGIEVKKIEEIISSSAKGRISSQLTMMRDAYKETILIIEGACGCDPKTMAIYGTGWPWNSIWLQVLSQQRCGTMVMQTNFPEHTAHVIVGLNQYYGKGNHLSVRRRQYINNDPCLSLQEAVLTCIKGIGLENAKEIMRESHNLQTVANASADQLMGITGIGTMLSKSIEAFFKENVNGK